MGKDGTVGGPPYRTGKVKVILETDRHMDYNKFTKLEPLRRIINLKRLVIRRFLFWAERRENET